MTSRAGMETIEEYELLDLTLRKSLPVNETVAEDSATRESSRAGVFIKHQDFVPDIVQKGSIIAGPVRQNLCHLVENANTWLRCHPGKTLLSCELIECPMRDATKSPDLLKSTYTSSGTADKGVLEYIYRTRVLRLWYAMHPMNRPTVEQIDYKHIIPGAMNVSKDVHKTKYEPLSCALASHNTNCKTSPLKVYEDFIPSFNVDHYTPFSELVNTLNKWRAKQQDIFLFNVQSIEYKAAEYKLTPDCDKAFYLELGDGPTHYVAILRVYYTKTSQTCVPRGDEYLMTSKRFTPYLTKRPGCLCGAAEFQDNEQLREKMAAWVKATGASVLSVETTCLVTRSQVLCFDPDVTYRRCRNPGSFQCVTGYCVYLCGRIEEPAVDGQLQFPEPGYRCCAIS